MRTVLGVCIALFLAGSAPAQVADAQGTGGAPKAAARNFLENSRFDLDVSGWHVVDTYDSAPGSMSWSSLDADGSSHSGSMELRTPATSEHDRFSVGQCLAVPTPTNSVVFGGRIRAPSGQSVVGLAHLTVEYFQSERCTGNGYVESRLGGIANADFWSGRAESVAIRSARSVRLIASVSKKYEWQGDDQTGKIDDHVPFQAFFDNLYLTFASEAERKKVLDRLKVSPYPNSFASHTTALWGKKTVQAPGLVLQAFGNDGRKREERVVEVSSLEQIGVAADLSTPYKFDDLEWYPLQDFSIVARNNEGNFGRPATLEFFLYRSSDASKKPLEIGIDSTSEGVIEGLPTASVHISILGRDAYRIQTLRAWYGCLKARLTRQPGVDQLEPTDDQLLRMPLTQYLVANPPGDYQLVAKYHSLEAGFWHDPVYSEPLRIRIVKKDLPCEPPARKLDPSPTSR